MCDFYRLLHAVGGYDHVSTKSQSSPATSPHRAHQRQPPTPRGASVGGIHTPSPAPALFCSSGMRTHDGVDGRPLTEANIIAFGVKQLYRKQGIGTALQEHTLRRRQGAGLLPGAVDQRRRPSREPPAQAGHGVRRGAAPEQARDSQVDAAAPPVDGAPVSGAVALPVRLPASARCARGAPARCRHACKSELLPIGWGNSLVAAALALAARAATAQPARRRTRPNSLLEFGGRSAWQATSFDVWCT